MPGSGATAGSSGGGSACPGTRQRGAAGSGDGGSAVARPAREAAQGAAAASCQPGYRCGALNAKWVARWPGNRGAGGWHRSRSGGTVTGIGACPDGSAKGAGGGGSSSWLSVVGLRRLLISGKAQAVEAMPPSPGSPPAKSGEEASGWWNGAVLRQLSGVVGPRQKPSPVVHRADSGYAFGRHNLLVALSRVTLSLSCRAFLGENNIFLDGRWQHPSRLCGVAVGLAAFGHA
uniref:Uncharacterized protein n=1 Tax=Oryza nivara TaxID=4536 RepID=A0A0E0FL62_ORYNI